jgi:rubrerythrin
MLTKEDYIGYLKQMKKVEEEMRDTYKVCSENIGDERIKGILAKLARDEARHAGMVEELKKLFISA